MCIEGVESKVPTRAFVQGTSAAPKQLHHEGAIAPKNAPQAQGLLRALRWLNQQESPSGGSRL